MYKFKINFSDLMEQIKKNDPNAGRHPDQDEIDEKKEKIGPALHSNLEQVNALISKIEQLKAGLDLNNAEDIEFNRKLDEMLAKAQNLRSKLESAITKLENAEELSEIAELETEIAPYNDAVSDLSNQLDALLQQNKQKSINLMNDKLKALTASIDQVGVGSESKFQEYMTLLNDSKAKNSEDKHFIKMLDEAE